MVHFPTCFIPRSSNNPVGRQEREIAHLSREDLEMQQGEATGLRLSDHWGAEARPKPIPEA